MEGIRKDSLRLKEKNGWIKLSTIYTNRKSSDKTHRRFLFYGRRIIELDYLAEQLWCQACDRALSLRDTLAEHHHGFASTLDVICRNCNSKFKVSTCRSYQLKNKETRYYVNGKTVLGMYDVGIGPCKVNDFFSVLNVPTVKPTIIKKYEEELAVPIEECTQESFEKAIKMEMQMTLANKNKEDQAENNNISGNVNNNNESEVDNEGYVSIACSFDGGWQKRGSGFCRNSLSGHASLFGHFSKQMVGVATRSKACSRCRGKGCPKGQKCFKNWSGSSKGMEVDMGDELIAKNKLIEKLKWRVAILIADDDAATIGALRKSASWEIIKWSDINHVKKNMGSHMYTVKIPLTVMKYFSRRFNLIVRSNKDNPDAIRQLLLCAVDHAYGNHDNCGLWCGYVQDEDSYVYKNLPGQKPLSNKNHYGPLSDILKTVAKNAEKIAPGGSTQINESFNHTVAVSHPKTSFYASTVSFPSRVNIAALKSNEKSSYITKVNEKAGYSPGKHTQSYRQKKDTIAMTRRNQLRDPAVIRRRKEAREKRLREERAVENREGISYSSGCGEYDFSELLDNVNDVKEKPTDSTDLIIVAFDLETTGLSVQSNEICQIAAAAETERVFSNYVVPKFPISKGAITTTGLTTHAGELYYHGVLVDTVSINVALKNFLDFLKEVSCGKKIVLVAHNCYKFDALVLLRHMQENQLMEEFQKAVNWFSDSIPAFRAKLKERAKAKKSFRQISLVEDFIGADETVNAHNAEVDVINVLCLIDKCDIAQLILEHSLSPKAVLTRKADQTKIKALAETLSVIKVSKLMRTRLGIAGITLEILKEVYLNGGEAGLTFFLCVSVDRRPRICKSGKVVDQFINELRRLTNPNSEKIESLKNCVLESDDSDDENIQENNLDDLDENDEEWLDDAFGDSSIIGA